MNQRHDINEPTAIGLRLTQQPGQVSAWSTLTRSGAMVKGPQRDGQKSKVIPIQEYPRTYPLPGLRRMTFIHPLERHPTLCHSPRSPPVTQLPSSYLTPKRRVSCPMRRSACRTRHRRRLGCPTDRAERWADATVPAIKSQTGGDHGSTRWETKNTTGRSGWSDDRR